MVYVSLDKVWLSRSTDGTNWEKEFVISDNNVNASYPSIAMIGSKEYIVWQDVLWYGSGNPSNQVKIYMRRYDVTYNTLSRTTLIGSFTPNIQNFQANPVIDGIHFSSPSYDVIMVAWKNPFSIEVNAHDYYGWSGVATVSGTNGYSFNPTIAYSPHFTNNKFSLCWEDQYSQKIKYSEVSYYNEILSFTSPTDVSPSNWLNNSNPQITIVDQHPTVTWSSRNNIVEGGASVHIRQKIGSSWQTITSFSQSTTATLYPVVGDYDNTNKMDVAWNIGNTVYRAYYSGSSWSGPYFVTSSGGTGININRKTNYDTQHSKAVWKKSDNTIAFYNVGGTGLSKESSNSASEETPLPYRLNRHAIIELAKDIDSTAKGSVCFEIAGISTSLNNTETKINYSTDENNLLASEPFKVTVPNMQLNFAGAIYGNGLESTSKLVSSLTEPLANIVLKDSETDKVLQNVWTNSASMLNQVQNKTFGEFRNQTVNLNKYLGKTVYVEVDMLGKAKKVRPLIVNDYLILSDSTSIAKSIANNNAADYTLPTDFTLIQNYPNPFNPTTNISFFLPRNQFVTLKVYNTLGKEVMTAVNENLEKRYHSVNINLSNEPSGVYFYYLNAGDFRATKKLLLLK